MRMGNTLSIVGPRELALGGAVAIAAAGSTAMGSCTTTSWVESSGVDIIIG